MKTYFKASQFTPTQWDTAETKADFADHFLRFVKSDFKRTLFYDWFYTRLSMTFGHIAHYSLDGFYRTFFMTTEGKLRFLQITVNGQMGRAGDPQFTYSDVEQAIAEKIQADGTLGEYEIKLEQETENTERATLARLKAKYERT